MWAVLDVQDFPDLFSFSILEHSKLETKSLKLRFNRKHFLSVRTDPKLLPLYSMLLLLLHVDR